MNLIHNRADDTKPTIKDVTVQNIIETAEAMELTPRQTTLALEAIAQAEDEREDE